MFDLNNEKEGKWIPTWVVRALNLTFLSKRLHLGAENGVIAGELLGTFCHRR